MGQASGSIHGGNATGGQRAHAVVVDAGMAGLLAALGYASPQYEIPAGFQTDWRMPVINAKPIERGRWMVALIGGTARPGHTDHAPLRQPSARGRQRQPEGQHRLRQRRQPPASPDLPPPPHGPPPSPGPAPSPTPHRPTNHSPRRRRIDLTDVRRPGQPSWQDGCCRRAAPGGRSPGEHPASGTASTGSSRPGTTINPSTTPSTTQPPAGRGRRQGAP